MVLASVGLSRYGSLRGVEQFMEAGAARQLNLCLDFIATLPGCYRPTVNEGVRSRPRQRMLRTAWETFVKYGRPFANLAAVIYTSTHDEVNYGNAADLGGPNGEVLSATVHAALLEHGPKFGVEWTGRNFSPREGWHFNVYPQRATITTAASTATVIAAEKPPTPKEDPDMIVIHNTQTGHVFAVAPEYVHHLGSWDDVRLTAAVSSTTDEVQKLTDVQTSTTFSAYGIPDAYRDRDTLLRVNPAGFWSREWENSNTLARLEAALNQLTPKK